jgi:tetratricopeptide (TPR) repeat protein
MQDTLVRAHELHVKGQFSQAEGLYRAILAREADSIGALQGLGALAYQQGRPADAAGFFTQLVALQPKNPHFRATLGELLRLLGRPDEAVAHLRGALAADPALPGAWNSMGLVALHERRYEDAERAYREAIRLDPGCAPAYNNLAQVLVARGSHAKAAEALRVALRLDPNNPVALANLAQVLCDMGDAGLLDEAEACCRRALALAGRYGQALDNLGTVLALRGRYGEAMECYQQSASLDPHRPAPHVLAGRLLQQLGKYDEAARCFATARPLEPNRAQYDANVGRLWLDRRNYDAAERHFRLALALEVDFAEAHHGLGLALLGQGRLGEAETALRHALRTGPAAAGSWIALARLQAERGELEQSCKSIREALALRPRMAEAYCRLATNLQGRVGEGEVDAMRQLLGEQQVSGHTRAWLHFSLAAVMDARESHGEAAALLETANSLQAAAAAAAGEGYDPDEHSRFIDRVAATFTAELAARPKSWVEPDPRPVFVVGLPRSGTTLVEQILASHPQVHGAGELPDVFQVLQALPQLVGNGSLDPFQALLELSPAAARGAARRYLRRLETLAPPTASRVVDKMPDNIQLLGLIAVLWPGARVIVCVRDLRDIAVSCWQTCFETIRWAYDPDHIARRLADHERILAHWKRCRPLEWIEVRYEDLVGDLEAQARRMIDYIGLEWDPACLEFHSTRRTVRTASVTQVRQPIYTRSVGKWRQYEPFLGSLFRALAARGVALPEAGLYHR